MALRRRRGVRKKKVTKKVEEGVVHIKSTFNNTIITFTDKDGNVLAWGSGGTAGFKGTRKSTPYAAQQAAHQVGKAIRDLFGCKRVLIRTKGPGPGRDAAIRTLQGYVEVVDLKDVTPVPHDGVRPKKKKRG